MYVNRNLSLSLILKFAWKPILFFLVYGYGVLALYHYFEHQGTTISIPFLPLSTIGIAVSFYVGFKNNQAYDRFWEGRKIWGGIVNYSRTWGNQVLTFVSDQHADNDVDKKEIEQIHKRLIYTHIGWLNSLRLQLRKPTSFSPQYRKKLSKKATKMLYKGAPIQKDWEKEVLPFLSMKCNAITRERANPATQIIKTQGQELRVLCQRKLIDDFRIISMMETLEEFYNLQGKCERIKNTPFPRQFAYFSSVFTWIFILILPFGLVGEFATMGHDFIWLTLPFYVLISWIFYTMEAVGDNSEDPFENFVNDVPMTALCRTIEIDLRDMLDEDDLPPKIQSENGILM